MRTSVVIAAHNEGAALWQTVRSCVETCAGLDSEVIIADDASTDGSVDEVERRFPRVRVVRHNDRRGASPTKDLGARAARGDVLVFLDGHCNPEPAAVSRLVQDVEQLKGASVVTPTITGLDVKRWTNSGTQFGHGYFLDLEKFDCGWLPLSELRSVEIGSRRFYETPGLIGCALAVGRELYERLWGFDRHMRNWGVEDLDFGLKSWLMGHPVLHDPEAVIGHRFRTAFDNYDVPAEHLVVNQLRMARKNFTQGTWSAWLDRCRQQHLGRLTDHPEGLWARVWLLFQEEWASAEQERSYLHGRRVRDEFWYAERFGLAWPRLQSSTVVPGLLSAKLAADPAPSPSPSPPPCPSVTVEIEDPTLPPGNFRTLTYGIFQTMAPQIRITLSPASDPAPGDFQVLVDDGDDTTSDDLDISSFFTFSGGVAVANIPELVPLNSLPGPNQDTYRALFTDPTSVRIVYFGENRFQFMLFGNVCFTGFMLHYDTDNTTVVGVNDGTEPIPSVPDAQMMTNHIILNFDPVTTDTTMSQFLLGESLRPQGIARDLGVIQARDLVALSGQALLDRISSVSAALGSGPDAAHLDPVPDNPTMSGERQPAAIAADYQPATADWSALGRQSHHQHFVMQTYPAHRLIDLMKAPMTTVRVLLAGSGVAAGNDFSGAAANLPNKYFVKGSRLFQATDVNERDAPGGGGGRKAVITPSAAGNPNPGDIRNVPDRAGIGNGHDTGVLALLAGDGVGDKIGGVDRTVGQIVLGTGKDAQVRIVRWDGDLISYYCQLGISAADANTRIHLVELSYSTKTVLPGPTIANLRRRYKAISDAGKLIVAPCHNQGRDVASCDAGRIGPSRAISRKDLAGNDAFKKNVLVVGYSNRVLAPNVVETKHAGSNFGAQISVVAPGTNLSTTIAGGFWTATGSSWTAPQVAGIAAELMLVNSALQQVANIVKVAEFIEATADDINRVAPQGEDELGHGRVNFWKAVLAAANDGLSSEGRVAQADGTDSYFKSLKLLADATTTWYGFEVRTVPQNIVLWFRNSLGQYSKVQDVGQNRPSIAGAAAGDALAYMSTQEYRNFDAQPKILPSLPFSNAELIDAPANQRFVTRFSIKRDQIADKTALLALPLGKDPSLNPEAVLIDLPIDDRTDLRRASGATGPNKYLIFAIVREFSNFVFHLDYNPSEQVRARLPNQNFTVGQQLSVPLELKNVSTEDIPVGRWIIRGQENNLSFDNVADFGPLLAGQTKTVQIKMTCFAAGGATLHVTILRAADDGARPVVAMPVGPGPNDSQDGRMTCT